MIFPCPNCSILLLLLLLLLLLVLFFVRGTKYNVLRQEIHKNWNFLPSASGRVMFLPPANEVWGKVIFLHLFVILFTGGACMVAPGGACMVAPRGACMVAPGGCGSLLLGGMSGYSWGACVVAPGGACVVAPRGMHGCSQGGMHGCSGGHVWLLLGGVHGCSRGACMGYDEIQRYDH